MPDTNGHYLDSDRAEAGARAFAKAERLLALLDRHWADWEAMTPSAIDDAGDEIDLIADRLEADLGKPRKLRHGHLIDADIADAMERTARDMGNAADAAVRRNA